jgi:hypothetical protein
VTSTPSVSVSSAPAVALRAFVETTGISLVVSTVVIVVPVIIAALQPCATIPAPGTIIPSCHIPWTAIGAMALISFLTGAVNSLTAYVGKTHQIAITPQAISAVTVPAEGDHQDRPQQIVGTTVTTIPPPVAPAFPPNPAPFIEETGPPPQPPPSAGILKL